MKRSVWEKTQSIEYGGFGGVPLGALTVSVVYTPDQDLLSYQQGALLGARLGWSFAGPVGAVSFAGTGIILAHFIN